MGAFRIHEEREWIIPIRRLRSKEVAKQTEGCFRRIGGNTSVSQGARGKLSFILIVVESTNQFKDCGPRSWQQRLKEFDDRQKINRWPIHGPHTRHEAGQIVISVLKY